MNETAGMFLCDAFQNIFYSRQMYDLRKLPMHIVTFKKKRVHGACILCQWQSVVLLIYART